MKILKIIGEALPVVAMIALIPFVTNDYLLAMIYLESFMNCLDDESFGRTRRSLGLLEQKGHLLAMPDSKCLGDGLFELRIHGRKQIRILYVFKNDKIYLIHGFIKKAWKIPRKDINYARHVQREIAELA